MSDEDPVRQVCQAAVRLLAAREHSRKELGDKLARRFPREAVKSALDALAEEGLQSDARFAEAYLHSRAAKGFGPLRIRAELRERGVSEALLEQAFEEGEVEWRALLRHVAERKYGKEPPADRREAGRRARFLASRGFPDHLVRDYLFSG